MYAWLQRLGVIAVAFASAGFAHVAAAQSTDGYSAILVFPLVVDTASFTQRFHFRASYPWDFTDVELTYYPAQETGAPAPIACIGISMVPGGEIRFESLRDLCPGLPTGRAFGTLVARNTAGIAFVASSRVSNPAGAGFTVEAFPASTFTSAYTAVTGLRRLAAQTSTPAYQSNCFIGNLAELAPTGAPVTTAVAVRLEARNGDALGQTLVNVAPGQLVRLLDVFAVAGVPAGDLDDVIATFSSNGSSGAGLLTFCTVQDNSSFGADFRIGKQEEGVHGGYRPGEPGARRITEDYAEDAIDSETTGAVFSIPAGDSRNVHLFYFRHPDVLTCAVRNQSNFSITPAYGLEMRLRVHDPSGWQVLAGGDNAVSFQGLYLGDKARHGGGANTTYQLEVESNGQNTGVGRPYFIMCTSGSGHSRGHLMRKGLAPVF